MYIKIHIRTNLFYAPLKSHEMMREQGVFKEISFTQTEKSSCFYHTTLISGIHRHHQFKQVSTNLHSRTMENISTLDTFS